MVWTRKTGNFEIDDVMHSFSSVTAVKYITMDFKTVNYTSSDSFIFCILYFTA